MLADTAGAAAQWLWKAEYEAHGYVGAWGEGLYAAQGGNERNFLQHVDPVLPEAPDPGGGLLSLIHI